MIRREGPSRDIRARDRGKTAGEQMRERRRGCPARELAASRQLEFSEFPRGFLLWIISRYDTQSGEKGVREKKGWKERERTKERGREEVTVVKMGDEGRRMESEGVAWLSECDLGREFTMQYQWNTSPPRLPRPHRPLSGSAETTSWRADWRAVLKKNWSWKNLPCTPRGGKREGEISAAYVRTYATFPRVVASNYDINIR